jgi:hypothetical protein
MRHCCAVVLSAALVIIAADPALARTKSKSRPQCADRPQDFSWNFLVPGQPAPQPNGAAPPVYNTDFYTLIYIIITMAYMNYRTTSFLKGNIGGNILVVRHRWSRQ